MVTLEMPSFLFMIRNKRTPGKYVRESQVEANRRWDLFSGMPDVKPQNLVAKTEKRHFQARSEAVLSPVLHMCLPTYDAGCLGGRGSARQGESVTQVIASWT